MACLPWTLWFARPLLNEVWTETPSPRCLRRLTSRWLFGACTCTITWICTLRGIMRQATFTEVRNHAKTFFDIPSWKRRKVQPLIIDGVSVSKMILAERDGRTSGRPHACLLRQFGIRRTLCQRSQRGFGSRMVRPRYGNCAVSNRADRDHFRVLPATPPG